MSNNTEQHEELAPPAPSAAGDYRLRMVEGPLTGKTWPLTEPVTAIGRGVGCHIRIEDAHVSRVQCEVAREGNTVRLRSAGTRNPTCVNNVPREGAILSPGDVISFPGSAFILDYSAASETQPSPNPATERTTQSFADAIHLRETFDAAAYAHDQRLGGDLHGLLSLVRSLGRAESLELLVARLIGHLRNRLAADQVWVGWRLDPHEDLALYPPATPEETRAAPFEIMRDVCASEIGVMTPGIGTIGGAYTLAAPLVHGRDAFGAIAVRRSGDLGAFTGGDLNFLVAAAECCAPLLRGIERLEQMQRDAMASAIGQPPAMSMLGDSPAMRALQTELRRAAVARINVLLQGETGVGKELAARMIHDLSARGSGPYVVVNCPAIPSELFESEVFGHERGAFTGATRRRTGLFELAHGGTLFLDEIGELSSANQARLLRTVETGAFRPVGSEKDIQVDVRIVCATNRRLPDKDSAHFRTDLYHRLAGIVVRIEPLRDHKEDIPELAHHFLRLASPHTLAHPNGFTQEAMDKLMAYDWPGNIRELRNVVERSCITTRANHVTSREIRIEAGEPAPPAETTAVSLDDLERRHILDILSQNGNNPLEAARALGISRSTFYYKLARHGIKPRSLPR